MPIPTWSCIGLGLTLVCLALSGCQPASQSKESAPSPSDSQPAPTRALRLLVVDDQRMAIMAEREWSARSETPLEITNIAEPEFAAAVDRGAFPARVDAVIFPPCYLGGLAERNMIARTPRRILDGEVLAYSDLFTLLRRYEATWGETTFAIPLGSPTLLMAYRGDLLPDMAAPDDWDNVSDWLAQFEKRGQLGETGAWLAQPLAEGSAANILLARAAPLIRMPGQISTLFDFRTMEPLINRPPFVQSLRDLVSLAQAAPAEALEWSVGDVQHQFESGKCVAALLWMTPPDPGAEPVEIAEGMQIRFAPLPGSRRVYSFSENDWGEHRGDAPTQVPLIGMAGRSAAVVKSSRRQKSAWNLLSQLAGTEMGTSVSAASHATAPARHLQVDQASRWTGSQIDSAAAREYGTAVKATLTRSLALNALNIPGQQAYMTALDAAVRDVIRGEATAQDALDGVALQWSRLNDEIGKANQLQAYARSLGIEP